MPESIGHFRVLEPLGSGGLGDVYKARDTRLGRTVAVRVLPPSIIADAERFQALSDLAVKLTELSHPNIAAVFEGGQEGAVCYLVFEYVQGEPLRAVISGRPLNARRALDFAINLADALAEAHARGLVHGDIRPETIVITPKDRAKLMNFGLARFTRGGAARVADSSPYVSPEELAGSPADARSDVYSLGAVTFEMLTGQPRARGTVLGAAQRDLPADLDRIVASMLAARPEARAQSAAAVAAELRRIAAMVDAKLEAAEAGAGVRHTRSTPGRGRRAAVLALVALMLLAIGAWWWIACC